MREQSYLGWIIYLLQPTIARKRKISFEDWLIKFGLVKGKTEKEKAEDVESMKKKSLEIAQGIIEMDKNRRS